MAEESLRIDKWLWRARFFKTRALAAKSAASGFRLNGERSDKTHALVRPGDVLTFKQARRIRVVEVAAIGERRGPASEAAGLYVDLEETGADGGDGGGHSGGDGPGAKL